MSRLAISTLVSLFVLVAVAHSQHFGRRRPVAYESTSLRNRYPTNVNYYIVQPNYYNARPASYGSVAYRRPSRWSSVSGGPVRQPNRNPFISRPIFSRTTMRPAVNQTVGANSTVSALNQTVALNATSSWENSTVVLTNLTSPAVNITAAVVEPIVLESATTTASTTTMATAAVEETAAATTSTPEVVSEATEAATSGPEIVSDTTAAPVI